MSRCRGVEIGTYWYLPVIEFGMVADASRNLLGTACVESLDLI
jgi:hypothetical protein